MLLLRILPLRLLFGVTALLVGTQMMGIDLVTPVIDWLFSHVELSISSLW